MNQGWRPARPGDWPAVRDLLVRHEAWACGCSERLRGQRRWLAGSSSLLMALSASRFLPVDRLFLLEARREARLAARLAARLDGMVYSSTHGLVFPVLDPEVAATEALSTLIPMFTATWAGPGGRDAYRLRSCMGQPGQVSAMEAALGIQSELRVEYYTMSWPEGRKAAVQPEGDLPAGCSLRWARPADLPGLLPLAQGYDREEVLTAIHQWSPAASRANQLNSLRHFSVLVAENDGRLVGRAQTNARGLNREQLGGIYVLPEFRGRGLGRAMVASMVASLLARKRQPCLFVKRNNTAAIRLYAGLGFETLGDFSIAYYLG